MAVDEQDQIIPGQGIIVIKTAVGFFRSGPTRPAEFSIDDEIVGFPRLFGFHGLFLFQIVQIFEKEHPGSLPGVVQLHFTPGLFPKDAVNILESLFEHSFSGF